MIADPLGSSQISLEKSNKQPLPMVWKAAICGL